MESTLVSGLQALFLGVANLGLGHVIMIIIACLLLYLGIGKGYEPLLLVPIGFGAILVNIPLADMMGKEGFLRFFYDAGVLTEVFPLLIFIGIGAMTDAHVASFFDKMVRAGVVKREVDFRKAFTLRFVNKAVGLNLRPKN